MRKVLVIAYSFPPVAVRSTRVVKFVKYLSRFGWRPVVLTPRRPYAPDMDHGLVDEVAAYPVTVYRTRSFEPVGLIERLKGSRAVERVHGGGARRLARLLRWVRVNCMIPDYRIGWVPWAILAGWRIIRAERIDAIFVSAEPFSSLLAAVALKRLTGRPLVMDFRDEWTPWARYRDPEKLDVVIAFERWLERRLVAAAETVVTVTPVLRDDFERRYPAMPGKFVCIRNGWDPDDFDGPPPPPGPGLTITHAGSLYRSRFPESLFTVLRALLDERPERRHRVRLRLLGTMSEELVKELQRYPYPEIIDYRGFVSAAEARRLMRASDILLLQQEAEDGIARGAAPSKLYEYLGAGRFILALAGDGPIREIVEEMGAGVVVDPADVATLRAVLLDWVEGRRHNPVVDEEHWQRRLRFSRLQQTALLAEWLDRAVAPRVDLGDGPTAVHQSSKNSTRARTTASCSQASISGNSGSDSTS
jgi:glycosyltransferase involved in cell wall biosynthesis